MILNLHGADKLSGVRSLRAVRTPTVLHGKRSTAFTVGLSQAEELWEASVAVSPLASPVLRYYALAQASRAVIACSSLGNQVWEPRAGHGLRFSMENGADELDGAWVEPDGEGLASTLAAALGSPLMEERASMSELICALPGQSLFRDTGCRPPRALGCRLGMYGAERETDGVVLALELPSSSWPISWPDGSEEVKLLLPMYPALTAGPQPVKFGVVGDSYGRPCDLQLGFGNDLRYVKDIERVVDVWASPVQYVVDADQVLGWCLPAVGGNSVAQHPLVTWLLVLYGLSMLARYHPAAWRHMLDVDRNPRATLLERLITHDSDWCMSIVELQIREFARMAATSR